MTLLENCSSVTTQSWSGVNNGTLNYVQETEILDKVVELKACLTVIDAEALSLLKMTSVSLEATFGTLERLCNIRSLLPKPTGNEDFDLFPRLTELDSRCLLELFLGSLNSWEKSLEGLHKIFTEPPVLDEQIINDLQKYLNQLQMLNFGGQTKASLFTLADHVRELHQQLTKVDVFLSRQPSISASRTPAL